MEILKKKKKKTDVGKQLLQMFFDSSAKQAGVSHLSKPNSCALFMLENLWMLQRFGFLWMERFSTEWSQDCALHGFFTSTKICGIVGWVELERIHLWGARMGDFGIGTKWARSEEHAKEDLKNHLVKNPLKVVGSWKKQDFFFFPWRRDLRSTDSTQIPLGSDMGCAEMSLRGAILLPFQRVTVVGKLQCHGFLMA